MLDVETADFEQAARSLAHDVGDPVGAALLRLQFRLADCGAMAGRDPGGVAWAGSYDEAATAALSAATDVVDAVYRVGAMFAQTARNYAAADAASGGHPAHVDVAAPPVHDGAPCLRPPSAAGGSGSTPAGWFLVEATVGRMWPDGHQDRLHAAAAAWTAAATALRERAGWTVAPDVGFSRDRLPEAEDMHLVCAALVAHLRDVAAVFDELAGACRALAGHIDAAHSAVEHELADLIGQSAVIEVGGALLSVVTGGAAEPAAQSVEAGRVAATAERIRDLIDVFTAAARAVSARIAAAVDRATQVAARARVLVGARLSAAEVVVAARYPRLAQAARERLAIYRLEGDAGHIRLRYIDDPRQFDPQVLRGMTADEVKAQIPSDWMSRPASHGEGTVYLDPEHPGRQIRIMGGYPKGSRPDSLTEGPYAVISQAGRKYPKIPLAGNGAHP